MSSSQDKPKKTAGRAAAKSGGQPSSREQDVGAALRSVYQRAVNEAVPDDLMDLLGKLG